MIENMPETVTRVQRKTNAIKQETNKLSTNQQYLMTDLEKKGSP